jgi:hypothetical protein
METIDGQPIEIAFDKVDCDLKLIQQTGNELQEAKFKAWLETTSLYILMAQLYKIRKLSLSVSEVFVLLFLMGHDLPDRRNGGRRKGWVIASHVHDSTITNVSACFADPRRCSSANAARKRWRSPTTTSERKP